MARDKYEPEMMIKRKKNLNINYKWFWLMKKLVLNSV